MKEESDNPVNIDEAVPAHHETNSVPKRKRGRVITGAAVAVVLIVVVTAWLLWPRQSGKPVPVPRSTSFEETSNQQTALAGDQGVSLPSEQVQRAGLKIETVGELPGDQTAIQLTTGTVQANTYRETPVMSLVGGIVRSVSGELGQNVKRGQKVASIFSTELADIQSRYVATIASLDEHHRHHMRTLKLVEIGAASRQDLEESTTQYREAETTVANLRQKLLLLGLSPQRIDSLSSPSQISSEVSVTAPSSGTLTSRSVNPGEVIEANKELMRVTDLSSVWVVGQVYEKDLATVRIGSGANVTSDAYPGRIFRGRVSYVDPRIDQATRTALVRIELANPGQLFKIGMYVNVALAALGGAEKTRPAVPKTAVQTIGNQQYVFVPGEQANGFVLRQVRLGTESNGLYPVLEGLYAGEHVVTEGSFLLRAEWLKLHPSER